MKAWKTVVDSLVQEKTKFVFGLVAGPWDFWEYLSETEIKPILVRHELSSVQNGDGPRETYCEARDSDG